LSAAGAAGDREFPPAVPPPIAKEARQALAGLDDGPRPAEASEPDPAGASGGPATARG
jgi:hypothetical protein